MIMSLQPNEYSQQSIGDRGQDCLPLLGLIRRDNLKSIFQGNSEVMLKFTTLSINDLAGHCFFECTGPH